MPSTELMSSEAGPGESERLLAVLAMVEGRHQAL